MDISGRTVLIVGGTTGIGRALAQRFVDAGSTVVVGGRNIEQVDGVETVRIDSPMRRQSLRRAMRCWRSTPTLTSS